MINISEYVKNDLEKYAGLYMPVKANLLEQIFVKKVAPEKLHANPYDEFCSKTVGPNDQIIEKYMKQIRINEQRRIDMFEEPLIVEKMRPDGYMLLNGHHRWAAALKLGIKKVPIHVTNLTHNTDIQELFQKTNREKRAAVNLDDVVFCKNSAETSEKSLFFPLNKLFPERIRRGIPALFYTLQENKYDVWIYSSGYSSTDYLTHLFRYHQIHVNGIINGLDRAASGTEMSAIKEMMAKKYRVTLNIDLNGVSWIRPDTKEFDMETVESSGEQWAKDTISVVKKLKDL